jgi:hypothetical protein
MTRNVSSSRDMIEARRNGSACLWLAAKSASGAGAGRAASGSRSGRADTTETLVVVVKNGRVKKVFYPVFPPDKSAAMVLKWLRERRKAPLHELNLPAGFGLRPQRKN